MPQKLKSKFNKYKYLIFTFLSLATFFAITKKQSGYSEDPDNFVTNYAPFNIASGEGGDSAGDGSGGDSGAGGDGADTSFGGYGGGDGFGTLSSWWRPPVINYKTCPSGKVLSWYTPGQSEPICPPVVEFKIRIKE